MTEVARRAGAVRPTIYVQFARPEALIEVLTNR